MSRPTDRACLVFPAPPGSAEGERRRWWYIEQPRPSVAFALQARVAVAMGAAGQTFLDAFFASPEQVDDLEADRATVGEALALRTLRRARSGAALCDQGDPADMRHAAARLWAVLAVAARRGGVGSPDGTDGRLDALLLAGEAERERGGAPDAYRWTRPSLLHALLLASGLRYDGEGPSPLGPLPPGPPPGNASPEVKARAALRDAVAAGGVGEFVRALDDALASPDELALLCAWAVLHLWRPF